MNYNFHLTVHEANITNQGAIGIFYAMVGFWRETVNKADFSLSVLLRQEISIFTFWNGLSCKDFWRNAMAVWPKLMILKRENTKFMEVTML